MVAPEEALPRVQQWAMETFGDEVEEIRGRMFYEKGWKYGPGVVILSGHSSGTCCIEFCGESLATFGADDRVRFVDELANLGCEARRLDVAIDFHGTGRNLIEMVIASCEAKQLCGAKTRSVYVEVGTGGRVTGETVYLGRRGGGGSGRLVRVYDKGLERKTHERGEWVRWETEFTGEAALKVQEIITQAQTDWVDAACSVAFGAVDFRESGGVSRSLSRRERCTWWSDVLAGVEPLRVKIVPEFPTVAGFSHWLSKSVLPTLWAMKEASEQTLDRVLAELIGEVEDENGDEVLAVEAAEPGTRSVLWEYIERRKRKLAGVEEW